MEQDSIEPGREYAYLMMGTGGPHHPVRAVPTGEASSGYVEVVAHFPDDGADTIKVKTRELVGLWNDEPTVRAYAAAVQSAHTRDERYTWADVAEYRYEAVKRQRALAQRLLRFGVVRKGRPYAGRGGDSVRPHDIDLQLNYGEIEKLLDAAERGPGDVRAPFNDALTPVGTE